MKESKEQCPLCSSNIEEYPIHFNTTFSMYELKSKKKQRIVKKSLETNVSSIPSQQPQQKKSVQDLSFDLALPSKSISRGSVLISPTKSSSNPIPSVNRSPLRTPSPSSLSNTMNKYNHMNNKSKSNQSHNNPINSHTHTVSKHKEANDVPNSTNNYTLADIEVLLNEQDDSGSLVVTPEDTTFNNMMDPMIWLDNIVQDQQMQQNDLKFNPLQPDQDLDILLGINSPSV
ncbi:unnamed protein product [Cunninghamella blakesleeana]